ncbi:MAG: histidine kinase [Flavobacteriales bacterium]|nr:histidine kinase [Flavobacteriales bacterium]
MNWTALLLLWSLSYLIYHYFAKNRLEEIRNLRLRSADRDNQLNNLRSQLNPHFMFNALNGIRALIDEDPAQAKRAITQLSAILRNAMSTVKRTTVPLGEEVDIVKAYLALEAMRFEERLRVQFSIPPELEREPVPPMLCKHWWRTPCVMASPNSPKAAISTSKCAPRRKVSASSCATAATTNPAPARAAASAYAIPSTASTLSTAATPTCAS